MAINPQYIDKDYLKEFLVSMHEYDTETLLGDLNVLELLDGKVPKDHNPEVHPYQAAEAFLLLFQEREDYELCDMLLKKWPELKNS